MISGPRVTIVVAVHGDRIMSGLFNRCVDSIIEQTYENLELVVVNDAADGFNDTVVDGAYFDGGYVDAGCKVGMARAFNMGLERVDNMGSDYVVYFGSDDMMDRTFISRLVDALPGHDAAFAAWRTTRSGPSDYTPPAEHTIQGMLYRETLPHPCLVPRWAYGDGYDETLESALDLDIKLKWLENGCTRFAFVNEPLWTIDTRREGREARTDRQRAAVAQIRARYA